MTTYASIGQRAGAYIIDYVIIIVLMVVVGLVGTLLAGILDSVSDILAMLLMMVIWLIMMVVIFGYYIALNGPMGRGQTYGKKIMNIKVTTEEGNVPSYGASALRFILMIIDGLFICLVGAFLIHSSDKNQRLGDSIAKTIVVKV